MIIFLVNIYKCFYQKQEFLLRTETILLESITIHFENSKEGDQSLMFLCSYLFNFISNITN